jgi:hypothetical protein
MVHGPHVDSAREDALPQLRVWRTMAIDILDARTAPRRAP